MHTGSLCYKYFLSAALTFFQNRLIRVLMWEQLKTTGWLSAFCMKNVEQEIPSSIQ